MSKTGVPEWRKSEAGLAAAKVCADQGHSVNLANSQFGICTRCKCFLFPWSPKDKDSQDRCLAEWKRSQEPPAPPAPTGATP